MSLVRVVGGGLAGCEAAWQLARRGIRVRLHEMKPVRFSPAHVSPDLAELVCSNSLRSDQMENAVGLLHAELRRMGSLVLRVADSVKFFIQFGSQAVEAFARENGLLETFERAGATVLHPGCGACIGCGPGVSETGDEVTVSAINRNFKGRSGPGKLWLASPLTVAASAFTGRISPYTPGMFARVLVSA